MTEKTMKHKIAVKAEVTMRFNVQAHKSKFDIREAVEKKIQHMPFVEGMVKVSNGNAICDGDPLEVGDIEFIVTHEPDLILLGKEACRILAEYTIEELITAIEDDGVDYDLIQYKGDLPSLLGQLAEWGDYAFLTEIEFNRLNEL